MADLFQDADLVFVYTRAQAIEDGVLVDASVMGRGAGFRCPVALTCGAWAAAVDWTEGNRAPQDESGRLWDVLWMAYLAARRRRTGPRTTFQVWRVPNTPQATAPRLLSLVLHVGPGDEGEPVATIMLPGED